MTYDTPLQERQGCNYIIIIVMALGIMLAMMIWMSSCSQPDQVLPHCQNVKATEMGNILSLEITSESDYVELDRNEGIHFFVGKEYYTCIHLSLDRLESLTMLDGGCKCEIK